MLFQATRWLPLLSSKYHTTKPAIHVGLHLEIDSLPAATAVGVPSGASRTEVEVRPLNADLPLRQARDSESEEDLTPQLNLQEGYYQIGRTGSQRYVFTVTVSFAANLNQVK